MKRAVEELATSEPPPSQRLAFELWLVASGHRQVGMEASPISISDLSTLLDEYGFRRGPVRRWLFKLVSAMDREFIATQRKGAKKKSKK
ncbi:MAG: hypothetical protein AB7O24_34160 [Kofleriaceae bacterium]